MTLDGALNVDSFLDQLKKKDSHLRFFIRNIFLRMSMGRNEPLKPTHRYYTKIPLSAIKFLDFLDANFDVFVFQFFKLLFPFFSLFFFFVLELP